MLPRQRVKWLSTIKREIVRMLVFAPYHLKKFPTAKLPPKEEEQENIKLGAEIPGVLEKFTREDWETKTGQIKRDVYMIVTKNVRNEAREYFKCSSLEGAELEDQGGPNSIGSQWETRILEVSSVSSTEEGQQSLLKDPMSFLGWSPGTEEGGGEGPVKVKFAMRAIANSITALYEIPPLREFHQATVELLQAFLNSSLTGGDRAVTSGAVLHTHSQRI
ncbi:unnamed protein product [Haemonchus placei]|uniref:Leishmanolysin-like peptidase n=1 Tax=Haemonchus placei TaxID=6290 RepID=A0A0N4VUI8_HAEPC|nr:unnamed protein product [Haemonchus placei]